MRFSGSTCTSLLVLGRKLYIANVGDSRSILVKGTTEEGKELWYLTLFNSDSSCAT